MNLSPAEFERARVARQEILERDHIVKRRPFTWLCLGCAIGLILIVPPSKDVGHWFMALVWIGMFVVDWITYRRVNRRYPANLKVLETLRQREPHLYASLNAPPEEHPLLEKWSQALEKRALLWRVDRFLSRRRTPQ